MGRKGGGGRQALAVDRKRGKQLGQWETKLGEWGSSFPKPTKITNKNKQTNKGHLASEFLLPYNKFNPF